MAFRQLTGGQGSRSRAAALSIGSNSALIVLKLVAGAVTGSVAILTEAIHSAIDLLASIVAFFSVRQAETPADASHRYGHEKFENVAAGIEGMLILVGSGVIVYTAVNHLVDGTKIESLGFGIAVVALATAVNLIVSQFLYRRADATGSAALAGDAAHLRTDAFTSLGVLVGLALVSITDETWIDPVVALVIAIAIVYTAVNHLVDGTPLESLGFGIGVVALATAVNLVVSQYLYRRAAATGSAALAGDAAHLRTDAFTSFGVLVGLALVSITDETWIDPVVALVIAIAIVYTGLRVVAGSWRVLVDEALPADEMIAIQDAIESFAERGVVGYHELRTRRAGPRRYVDMHVQFRSGTTLEEAHGIAHSLQDTIRERLRGADVLIHLEPQDRVRPGNELGVGNGGGGAKHPQ